MIVGFRQCFRPFQNTAWHTNIVYLCKVMPSVVSSSVVFLVRRTYYLEHSCALHLNYLWAHFYHLEDQTVLFTNNPVGRYLCEEYTPRLEDRLRPHVYRTKDKRLVPCWAFLAYILCPSATSSLPENTKLTKRIIAYMKEVFIHRILVRFWLRRELIIHPKSKSPTNEMYYMVGRPTSIRLYFFNTTPVFDCSS